MTLRLAFMGTPDFSVPALAELIAAGHDVVAVYSQPPRKAGRGMAETPSPVHAFAEAQGIEVRTPEKLRDDAAQEAFRALDLDAAIVAAYGLILPQPILDAPRLGCLNIHASLLPRWRGAAPIQRAIMAGDSETGVAIMQMEKGLDTGPVLLMERTPIGAQETAGELHDRLSAIGAGLMVRALAALERDSLEATPQPEYGVTYADKIDKAEARIDWTRPAHELDGHIRGLSPFPGAWCEVEKDGGKRQRVKVLRAVPVDGSGTPGAALDDALTIACGDGALRLTQVQRAGKGVQQAEEFLRGFPVAAGTVLT
ncbi:methionyl-tRNA formyltransferase [Pyruvatibacter mobilis]|uniref:methionyl-tRNA formyltransferase n=1 Tax=Pyruvatibacter mobilis TaxID=1712261 RepID=UPI003D0C81AE